VQGDDAMRKPHFTVYQDAAGEWRWRLEADNGRITGHSGAYTRALDAWRAVETVREAAAAALAREER